jgi:hypothetical protein
MRVMSLFCALRRLLLCGRFCKAALGQVVRLLKNNARGFFHEQ